MLAATVSCFPVCQFVPNNHLNNCLNSHHSPNIFSNSPAVEFAHTKSLNNERKREGNFGSIFLIITTNLKCLPSVQHHKIFNKIWMLMRFISRLHFEQIIAGVLNPGVSFVWKEESQCQYIWPGTFELIEKSRLFLFFFFPWKQIWPF